MRSLATGDRLRHMVSHAYAHRCPREAARVNVLRLLEVAEQLRDAEPEAVPWPR